MKKPRADHPFAPTYNQLAAVLMLFMEGDPNGECGCTACQMGGSMKVRLEQLVAEGKLELDFSYQR